MDEIPGGFWRAVAEGFIHGQLNKPFFWPSLPEIRSMPCWPLALSLRTRWDSRGKACRQTDAFIPAFLGMSGEAGVVRRILVKQANKMLERQALGSMRFWDYVGADVTDRLGYKADGWSGLIMERGTQRISPKVALINGWEYASAGAALGATHPDVLRAMFERTYVRVPEEKWQGAYAAGLDIGPEQPRTNYREAQETENNNFMEYCREFRPDLYSVLQD
jgi:hypothetical protein